MFSWLNIHKLLETSLLDDEHHILSYTTICKKMFCQTPAEDNTFLFISQCLTSFFILRLYSSYSLYHMIDLMKIYVMYNTINSLIKKHDKLFLKNEEHVLCFGGV